MMINNENYEAYLIEYIHGELSETQVKAVQQFLQENVAAAEELKLLQQTILTPDEEVIFKQKNLLYKKEESKAGQTTNYKRYFAIAAMLVGMLLAIYFMMKKEEKPSFVKHSNDETPAPQNIANQPKMEEVKPYEKKDESLQQASSSTPKHKTKGYENPEPRRENVFPFPEIKPQEELVQEHKQEEINERQIPSVIKDSLPTFITQEKQIPKEEFTPEEDDRVANRLNSTRNAEWNPTKKPRLFRLINGMLGFTHKLKQKEEQLVNTQMTVMVGNKILFNINN